MNDPTCFKLTILISVSETKSAAETCWLRLAETLPR